MSKHRPRDAVIGALIGKLPIPGATWDRQARVAWLRQMAMAFDSAFGPERTIAIDEIIRPIGEYTGDAALLLADAGAASIVDWNKAKAEAAPSKPALSIVPKTKPPRFFIDVHGFARKDPSGDQILPHEIGGDTLFDDRGEFGDLGSIVWADGSQGVMGLQIDISATPKTASER